MVASSIGKIYYVTDYFHGVLFFVVVVFMVN